jgi:hypothetical protein
MFVITGSDEHDELLRTYFVLMPQSGSLGGGMVGGSGGRPGGGGWGVGCGACQWVCGCRRGR